MENFIFCTVRRLYTTYKALMFSFKDFYNKCKQILRYLLEDINSDIILRSNTCYKSRLSHVNVFKPL